MKFSVFRVPFSAPGNPLRASAPPREPHTSPSVYIVGPVVNAAFSLVELLVVIAIIAVMVGLSTVAVQGFRAPAVRQATEQAMSGLSLARQIAITKNTHAAFLIANQTNAGFPSEPFRHWSVVYSNKGANNWTMAKDWEALPDGAVFSELLTSSGSSAYNTVSVNPFNVSTGQALPGNILTPSGVALNFSTVANNSTISFNDTPCISFSGSGLVNGAAIALRITAGTVMSGNATVTSPEQYYFVETDTRTGRIRMRSPESYESQ